MSGRYKNSENYLEHALKYIPLGAQTFSKSSTQFPLGVSPYFAKKAKGSRLWDIDNNEYIDFISGLCSIILGYCDQDVDRAVVEQVGSGTIFSLSHKLEAEVAEQIVTMVPCAEMVRFGKNGSDATAGAIRLARAYTGRDRVAVCGYHGWQDWYIGSTTRNLGVPDVVKQLTSTFKYNDINSLEKLFAKYPGEYAAVILEPMNIEEPRDGFLENVKALTASNGAVLVFDEMITGFRFSNGGAQELFGVTPDLATFGKGLANGFPLSAITGKKEIMRLMEEVFFSFTYGGETLSLAAAKETLNRLQNNDILGSITKQGLYLKKSIIEIIDQENLNKLFNVKGHPSWTFLTILEKNNFDFWKVKTLLMQEMLNRNILTLGSHNLSFSHTRDDIDYLVNAYSEVLPFVYQAAANKKIDKYLKCEPLAPLFKVR